MPTGATLIDSVYLDGRPKASCGTGRPPLEISYEVNSTGIKTIRTNGSGTANGWSEQQTDNLGRIVKVSTPAWQWNAANSNIVDVASTYSGTTGLLTKQTTTYRATGAALSPSRIFQYDSGGRRVREGLDVNNDSALTLSSNDRITDYITAFEKDTWGWRSVSTTKTYPQLNATTAVEISKQSTRLTGFNNGSVASQGIVVGDSVHTDANGQNTVTWEYVDPTQKTRRTHVTRPGSSVGGYSITTNGYLSETQEVGTGVRLAQSYDSLGRLTATSQVNRTSQP